LRVDGPQASAAVIRAVLAGADGAPARVVLANAAAALLAAERVTTLREGVAMAAEAGAQRARGPGAGEPLLLVLTEGARFMAQKNDHHRRPPASTARVAVAVTMLAPELDLIGLAATAGNVSPEQATRNVHVLVEQLDPPRWPRLGAALSVPYDQDGSDLNGPMAWGATTSPALNSTIRTPATSS